MSARRWVSGIIGLDAGDMGGGESAIGIVLEQVSCGFDGTNHGEWANPSVHEGFAQTAPPDRDQVLYYFFKKQALHPST